MTFHEPQQAGNNALTPPLWYHTMQTLHCMGHTLQDYDTRTAAIMLLTCFTPCSVPITQVLLKSS
jgi:hypothetical protein